MITLIVPSRNRAHTLKVVASSFYRLKLVDEIIFVLDAGTDDSADYLAALGERHPEVRTLVLVNEHRLGAAGSRMRGIRQAGNDLILFCDDDLFLEAGYDEVCLDRLQQAGVGAVSGRHIFRLPDETPEEAVRRFGNGLSRRRPFNRYTCEFADDATYEGDLSLPLTNACVLTRRELLLRFPFDPFYSRGNGYREESDFQMNLFVHGYSLIATSAVHSIHLHLSEVRTGGQRVNRLSRIYWAMFYTDYFYRKYWTRYAKRVGLPIPRQVALAIFLVHQVYTQFVRPLRHVLRPSGYGVLGLRGRVQKA